MVLQNIERQVLDAGRHIGRLLASGQHLKRGIRLHGAPGTSMTLTVRCLLGTSRRRPAAEVAALSRLVAVQVTPQTAKECLIAPVTIVDGLE
jgi:hypothetical protein